MRAAIIGLPQSGKTSLFKILTKAQVDTGFGGGHQAQIGVARVPDRRLDDLAKLFDPQKLTHTAIEFMDVPSISKDNLREPSYLGSLRNVDALMHVVRAFGEDADPKREIADVDLELILSDLAQIEKRMERLEKDMKKLKNQEFEQEHAVLLTAKAALEKEQPLRELELDPNDKKRIRGFMFLSEKPMLYVVNVADEQAGELDQIEARYKVSGKPNTGMSAIAGRVEAELAELPPDELAEFMSSYGLKDSGLERLVRAVYLLMGFVSFFTVGEEECRAWTLRRGETALDAAGAIHTDLAKHFIRAEVMNWKDLLESGSIAGLRDRGQLRLEGKDYVVQDGNIVHIRHSG